MLKLDFFPKFLDSSMTKRTNFGAIVSILMVISAAFLCHSEAKNMIRPTIKEQLVSVSSLRNSLHKLKITYEFIVNLPCVLTHLDVLTTSNDEVKKEVNKVRLDMNGNEIKTIVDNKKCGTCYGAIVGNMPCCNTCQDVVDAYQQRIWSISNMRNWTQCKDEKIDFDGGEKCKIYGKLKISAIEGSFHIAPGVNVLNQFGHQHDVSPIINNLNLSHEIKKLTFGDYIGQSPLDDTRVFQTNKGQYHYRYNLKAVPTVTQLPNGKVKNGYQYTVNFAEIPIVNKGRYGPGIFVVYNFAPVAVLSKPDRPVFPIFVARCISIIGGTFMLARLIDSFGNRLNTLEGKMQIGKLE